MKTKKKIVKALPKKLTVSAAVSKTSYEKDFFKWVETQARYLEKKEFSKLDIENLIEEIESLGKSERRTLESHLENLLMHMLKVKYQANMHTKSWDLSIKNSFLKFKKVLKQNPSLKPKLNEILKDSYETARLKAAMETQLDEKTFPIRCPWTIDEILNKKD